MELKEIIITLLKEKHSLKAKDITSIIKSEYGIETDKKEINRILYHDLKGIAYQNNEYQWNLSKSKKTKVESEEVVLDTPLSNLCTYYIDCLSKDIDSGISDYASSKYGLPEYGQIDSLDIVFNNTEQLYSLANTNKVIDKVRKDRHRLILQLGCPLYLRKIVARNTFYVVEPILLLPFQTESFMSNETPILADDIPRLNFKAIQSLSGLQRYELFEEVMLLSDELGLNTVSSEQPDMDEIAMRLQQIRPNWPWVENINPENLTSVQLDKTENEGIYNGAALFASERSLYTQGLEKELEALKKVTEDVYSKSALGNWISRKITEYETEDLVLIEPIPLNDEQREVVNKALQAPLTVVTGPPGTGKSQVVTSIIINAVHHGQKVLFASKNHKAVDVVNERVNGLTSRPILLKLGSNELQAEVARYLSSLLSSTTSESDQKEYETSIGRHEQLVSKIKYLRNAQDELIKIRNETDSAEQQVEKYREFFDKNVFYAFRKWTSEYFNKFQKLNDSFYQLVEYSDKSKQTIIIKLFWFAIKKSRFEKTHKSYLQLEKFLEPLKVNPLKDMITDNNLYKCYEILNQLKTNLDKAKEISNYFMLLNKLKSSESIFELSLKTKLIEEEIAENSHYLWESWLKLLPDRLTQDDRKTLGDYTTLLNLIVKANSNNTKIDRKIFAKYYSILPQVSNILSCWSVTSLSVRGKVPFESGFFDLVVIDEASQCDIASAIPLLYRSKRAIIIGDSKQLRHISSIDENQDIQLLEKYGLEDNFLNWSYAGNSLFGLAQAICSSNDLIVLKDHHRSHADIINFSNSTFYNGYLRVATKYEKLKSLQNEPVTRWIDISGQVETPKSGGSFNTVEANAVVKELERLVGINYKGSIGVVSPFRAQANRINDLVQKNERLQENLIVRDFLCDTVHRFQGDERDIIIFSPVISTGIGRGSKHFLARTGNLFNVAITRARAALIIVGNKNSCGSCGITYMEKFVDYISTLGSRKDTHVDSDKDLGSKYPSVPSGIMVSEWEKVLYEVLYKAGIKTIPQYPIEQYSLDLALFKNSRKLDIEVDGEKYHRTWDGELCKRDQLRNKRLIELGWDVLRFWVYEIRDDKDECVKKIQDWLNNS